jgi:DNA-binding transcriptional LysR family regulator
MPELETQKTPESRAKSDHPALRAPSNFEPRVAQLRALVCVAREGSYTKAARILSYTESGVFLQVRTLERLVGLPLASRVGQRIELTPAGEVVYQYALRILEDIEGMAREIAGISSDPAVVVGGGRSTSAYYLTPLLAEFSAQQPGYRVQLHIMSAQELLSAVELGNVDLGVSGGVRHLLENRKLSDDIRVTPWFHGGWMLVRSTMGVPFSEHRKVYVPDFAAFLLPRIAQAIAALGYGGSLTIETIPSGEGVKSAALHGLAAAVLPGVAIAIENQAGLVETQELDLGSERVMLIHRRPRLLTPGARELLAYLIRARHRFSRPRQ